MTTASATLTLLLLMDPLGNLGVFASVLKDVEPRRRSRVVARELVFALGFLTLFLFVGRYVFGLLELQQESVAIAGGIILLVIAFRMLFPGEDGVMGKTPGGEPFLVPLAIPMVAGPSTISLVLLLSSSEPERSFDWLLAIFGAWAAAAAILACSGKLGRLLGEAGLTALQKLMGMLLVCLAVQMLVNGIGSVVP